MATTTKAAKPTVTKVSKTKPKTATKATAAKTTKAEPKTTAQAKSSAKPTVTVVSKPKPKTSSAKPATKTTTKAAPVKVAAEKKTTASKATVYHVSKRDNNGREWKVFIEKSTKPIKIFDTQADALKYANSLAKNKDDGSYVVLHGLDGKIRKY